MANNDTQYTPELLAMAQAMGKSVDELMETVKAVQAVMPREQVIANATSRKTISRIKRSQPESTFLTSSLSMQRNCSKLASGHR